MPIHTLPGNIETGMKVVDSTGDEIGTVEAFKAGDDDPATPEVEATGVNPMDADGGRETVVDVLARAFAPEDKVPAEIQEKLLREGFVRIDSSGLFASDRYVTTSQISGVRDGKLILSVPKSDLIKRK